MSHDAFLQARFQDKLAARANGATKLLVGPAPVEPSPAVEAEGVNARYQAKLAVRAAAAKGGDVARVEPAFDVASVEVTEAGLAGLKLDQLQAVAAARGVNTDGLRSKREIAEAILTDPAKGGDAARG